MRYENPLYAITIRELAFPDIGHRPTVQVECAECRKVVASWDADDVTMLRVAAMIEMHIRGDKHRSRHDSESVWLDVALSYRNAAERRAGVRDDGQTSLFPEPGADKAKTTSGIKWS